MEMETLVGKTIYIIGTCKIADNIFRRSHQLVTVDRSHKKK